MPVLENVVVHQQQNDDEGNEESSVNVLRRADLLRAHDNFVDNEKNVEFFWNLLWGYLSNKKHKDELYSSDFFTRWISSMFSSSGMWRSPLTSILVYLIGVCFLLAAIYQCTVRIVNNENSWGSSNTIYSIYLAVILALVLFGLGRNILVHQNILRALSQF